MCVISLTSCQESQLLGVAEKATKLCNLTDIPQHPELFFFKAKHESLQFDSDQVSF